MSLTPPSSPSEAYSETTRGITVSVQPVYLEHQSEPNEGRFFGPTTFGLKTTAMPWRSC